MSIQFWNTGALAKALAHDEVSERDAFGYYLANAILWTLLSYYATYFGANIGWLFFYEIFVVTVITVFALYRCYQANGGAGGRYFVLRATCLSFPIALKINVLSISLWWLHVLTFSRMFDPMSFRDPVRVGELIYFLWAPAFAVVFFWRLWHHLTSIQNMLAPNLPLNRTRADNARAG